jgi:hypothetical protein
VLQRDLFFSRFLALSGSGANVDLVPSCALRIVGIPEIRNLLVVADSGASRVIDIRAQPQCDQATLRFTRALWAGFFLGFGFDSRGSVERLERHWLPILGDATRAALGDVALDTIWIAVAVFRCAARGGGGAHPVVSDLFVEQRERVLLLELELCSARPDNETFAHCLAAEFDLTDDEVRNALHAIWPGSDVWDAHLQELAASGVRRADLSS